MSQAGEINIAAGLLPPQVPTSFVTNSGTAVPVSQILSEPGNNTANNGYATWTTGSGSTLNVNSYGIVKWVVNQTAGVGTHTTIGSALASASAGDVVFVTPGTYTENITMPNGVTLQAFPASPPDQGYSIRPAIQGTITITNGGYASYVNGFALLNNGAADIVTVTGNNGQFGIFTDCYFNQGNSGNYFVTMNTSYGFLTLFNCTGDLGTGAAPFNIVNTGGGDRAFLAEYCDFDNNNTSTAPCLMAAGGATLNYCKMKSPLSMTGGKLQMIYSNLGFYTYSFSYVVQTASGAHVIMSNCIFENNSASNPSLINGSGCTMELIGCTIVGAAGGTGTIISNSGTLTYDIVGQRSYNAGTAQGVVPVPSTSSLTYLGTSNFTQGQLVAITTPGSYPYTTLQTDYVILVDTSQARTITPMSSPIKGQTYRIKDNVGSAATHNITITPSGKNIDGGASATISTNYGFADIVFNGTQWNVI